MKKKLFAIICLLIFKNFLFADIAPSPIIVKGIFTNTECKVQLKSEVVNVEMYNDSAQIECIFNLINHGDSVTLDVGFPEMNFQYWGMGDYSEDDKKKFQILVDGTCLSEDYIRVPEELDSIYRIYMLVYEIEKEYDRKTDSIYIANRVVFKSNGTYEYSSNASYNLTLKALNELSEWRKQKPYIDSSLSLRFRALMEKGKFPWYLWKVSFKKNEAKTIKVTYSLPSGMGYGADFRYFNYLLNTGKGWFKEIEKAEIMAKLHDIEMANIEEIKPSNFEIDNNDKEINWIFESFEPTEEHDIYVKYYNNKERSDWNKYKLKRKRALFFSKINPFK